MFLPRRGDWNLCNSSRCNYLWNRQEDGDAAANGVIVADEHVPGVSAAKKLRSNKLVNRIAAFLATQGRFVNSLLLWQLQLG
jgi:hypothetical protein